MFEIHAQSRVWVGGHQREVRALIEPLLAGAARPPYGPIDVAVITPQSADEFAYFAGKLLGRLTAAGVIWAVVPSISFEAAPHEGAPDVGTDRGLPDVLAWETAVQSLGLLRIGTRRIAADVVALSFARAAPVE